MPSAWPDLGSGWLPSEAPDRSALLRLHAEMFAKARARDRETLRAFEAIALGFLPRVDIATLIAVAEFVAPCPDTPDAVLVALAQRSREASAIVAGRAPRLPGAVVDLLLGTAQGRLSLAGRTGLDASTLERLLVCHEPGVDEALA